MMLTFVLYILCIHVCISLSQWNCLDLYSYNHVSPLFNANSYFLDCNKGAQFTCANGDCIVRGRRCDGYDDCGDLSDEWDCSKTLNFKPTSIFYMYTSMISSEACYLNETTWYFISGCADGFWYCAAERLCMPDEWRCDRYQDCTDPDDELAANCSTYHGRPQKLLWRGANPSGLAKMAYFSAHQRRKRKFSRFFML